jgi:hypothetical protein
MVSISAGEGPGPVISRGFTERRVLRNSMVSGMRGLAKFVFARLAWRGGCGEAGWLRLDRL